MLQSWRVQKSPLGLSFMDVPTGK